MDGEYHRWHRPSALVGVLGGLVVGFSFHVGVSPGPMHDGLLWTLLAAVVDPVAIFRITPFVGYVLFAALGAVLGLVRRRLYGRAHGLD
jgi:hypothetical protein